MHTVMRTIYVCITYRVMGAMWDVVGSIALAHSGGVERILFFNNTLFTSGGDGRIRRWTWPNLSAMGMYQGHSGSVTALTVTSDGVLLSGSSDNSIRSWNIETYQQTSTQFLGGHGGTVSGVHFDDATKIMYSCGSDNKVMAWNPYTGAKLRTYTMHTNWVWTVVTDPSGASIYTGSTDMTLDKTDAVSSNTQFSLNPGYGVIRRLEVYQNVLYVVTGDGYAASWDATTGAFKRVLYRSLASLYGIAISGNSVFVAGTDKIIKQYSHQTGQELPSRASAHLDDIWYLAITSNRLASGSRDGSVKIWDIDLILSSSSTTRSSTTSSFSRSSYRSSNTQSSTMSFTTPSTTTTLSEAAFNLGGYAAEKIEPSSASLPTSRLDSTNSDSPNFLTTISPGAIAAGGVFAGSMFLGVVGYLLIKVRRDRSKSNLANKKSRGKSRAKSGEDVVDSQTALASSRNHIDQTVHISVPTVVETQISGGSTTHFSNATTMTEVVTVHELSIPAFLEFSFYRDFKRGEVLSAGGSGSIYLGYPIHPDLIRRCGTGQKLVVKSLAVNSHPMNPRVMKSFYQEISLMWKYRDQPYFARVYGFSSNPPCILLKYYDRGDLLDYIEGFKNTDFTYSKKRVIILLKQVSQAVAFMHKDDIAHCDIKPQNILLELNQGTGFLTGVLTDFGLARVISRNALQVEGFPVSDLRGGSVVYSAPEVLTRFREGRDEKDPAIWRAGDAYALSVTLMEMLTRQDAWFHNGSITKTKSQY